MRNATLWLVVFSCVSSMSASSAAEPIPIGISDEPMLRAQSYEDYWRHVDELGLNFWRLGMVLERGGERAWSDLPDAKRVKQRLEELDRKGWLISFTDFTVNMTHVQLPERLAGKALNDPEVLAAYEARLNDLMAKYGEHFDLFNIGNEVSTYYASHTDEWPAFVDFVKHGVSVLKRANPDVKVGVIFTNDGADPFWPDIAPYVDYVAFTYYAPFSMGGAEDPASQALDPKSEKYFVKSLNHMLELAGDKPVLITEIGCGTDPRIDSSPEVQAGFVEALFEWLRGKEDRILGVCYLGMQDWSPEEMPLKLEGLLSEEWLNMPGMIEWLTSLGLLDEHGDPKPAYYAFKREVELYLHGTRVPGRTSAKPVWKALGPGGGYFVDFLFHPEDPDWMLAGGDDSLGIWKSTNGGDSWYLVTEEWRNVTAWEFERDPEEPNTIYTVDIYGRYPLLKSRDGGETWERKDRGITQRRTHCVTVVPKAPDGKVILVGTMVSWEDPGDAPVPDDGGIFKSTDGGVTWRQIQFPATAVKYLETAPDGKTVYAGARKGLFRSADGGQHWERVQNGLPEGEVSGLNIMKNGDIYTAVPENPGDALFHSSDGGQSWTGLGLPHQGIWDIIVEPGSSGKTMYVGTLNSGVFKTTDGGETWRRMNEGIFSAMVICLGQNANRDLFCSTFANEGILRSKDGAQSWHRATTNLTPTCLSTMRFDPNDGMRALVTALGPYSFDQTAQAPTLWEARLDEHGEVSWNRWDHLVQQTYSPAVSAGAPEKLLVGTFGKGVIFSKDGGKTFESVHDTGFCTDAAFDPGNPDVALAPVLDVRPDYETVGFLIVRTEDGGENWMKEGVAFYAEDLILERDSDRVWAAADGGVFLSEDNGATWELKALNGENVTALAQHPDRPEVLYAANRRRTLFKSVDRGETWQVLEHPQWHERADIHAIRIDINDPDRLYVGLNAAEIHPKDHDALRGGVWMSPDGGETWKEITGTMACDHIRDMVQSPNGKWLYAVTYSGGLYKLDLVDLLR